MANNRIRFGRQAIFFGSSLAVALVIGCAGGGGGGAGGSGGEGGEGGDGPSGPGPTSTSTGTSTSTSGTGGAGGVGECDDVKAPEEVLPGATDPEGGNFTMDEALAELPEGPGPLRAIIETDLGTLTCELFPDKAPIGVANFVGLARGRRAWKDPETNKWVKRRFYDGLIFHRIINDFMIQGGDPLGTGYGGPGYQFVNEIAGLTHVAGTLAYANAGVDTNGSQFYIAETPQPGLDSGYTIFGQCGPLETISKLAAVPTGAKDKPTTDVHMVKVSITRCAP